MEKNETTVFLCVLYVWSMLWMYLHICTHQETGLEVDAKCKLGNAI